MRLQRQFSGQIITLDTQNPIGGGGEGRIYSVLQDSSLVAKIYHKPTDQDADKLTVMFSHPPDAPMGVGHSAIAWPVDLLRTTNSKQQIIGFLMPRVSRAEPIHIFYNPRNRREKKPLFNYRYLHRTARNLVAAVNALHNSGYAIGDVNESNILVTDTALVTLVDTDSFQVRDPYTLEIYRCPVGKPEFTPPELQGQSFRKVDRKPEHDLFGVAILIFQLLMEGTHPFAGVYQGRGEPPTIEARIKAGHFPYGKKRVPYRPMPLAPDFKILHPSIQELFINCFEDGHQHPESRPDPKAWLQALRESENSLVNCQKNHQHLYGNYLKSCPWCERAKFLKGRDPFPSREAVRNKQHLQPVKPQKWKLLSVGQQKNTSPPKPKPPKPIIITRKMGQYQPLLTPVSTKSKPPSSPIIPLPGGGYGIVGIAKDAMWGSLWGVLFAAAIAGLILGIIKGSVAVFGGIIMGILWGGFFALAWEYVIPMGFSSGSLCAMGAFWGGFIAAAISGSVYGISNRLEIFGQALIFGGFLGTIWGGVWSAFKPPLALPVPGRVWGRRGLFLGAIWGAFLGTIIGAILAGVFVFQKSMNHTNSLLELVSILISSIIPAMGVGATGGIIGGAVFGPILGAPTLPLSNKLSGIRGAFLGGIWGCFLGVIIGIILGRSLPLMSIDLISIMRIDSHWNSILSTILGAGLGAIGGCFSGAAWGGMGKW